MNAEDRAVLRALVQQRLRERANVVDDPGEVDLTVRRGPKGPAPSMRHGTEAAYNARGCRCQQCKDASAAARHRRRKSPNVSVHNAAGYSNGCRCYECREAHNERWRKYRQAKRQAATV